MQWFRVRFAAKQFLTPCSPLHVISNCCSACELTLCERPCRMPLGESRQLGENYRHPVMITWGRNPCLQWQSQQIIFFCVQNRNLKVDIENMSMLRPHDSELYKGPFSTSKTVLRDSEEKPVQQKLKKATLRQVPIQVETRNVFVFLGSTDIQIIR